MVVSTLVAKAMDLAAAWTATVSGDDLVVEVVLAEGEVTVVDDDEEGLDVFLSSANHTRRGRNHDKGDN